MIILDDSYQCWINEFGKIVRNYKNKILYKIKKEPIQFEQALLSGLLNDSENLYARKRF